jgi:hypothetical protein
MRTDALRFLPIVLAALVWLLTGPNRAGAG